MSNGFPTDPMVVTEIIAQVDNLQRSERESGGAGLPGGTPGCGCGGCGCLLLAAGCFALVLLLTLAG